MYYIDFSYINKNDESVHSDFRHETIELMNELVIILMDEYTRLGKNGLDIQIWMGVKE